MVEVFTSFSASEAGMVKELLYNEGIFSAISNELGSSLLGGTPSAAGEVKVYVSEGDAEKAEELIEAYMDGNPLESDEGTITCGHCGAEVEADEEACPHCGEPFTDD